MSCSYNGTVDVWDLYDKKIENYLKINKSRIYTLINWNQLYFIVGDYNKGTIFVIDLDSLKIISLIKNENIKNIITLKKVRHPIYNESLLILSDNGIINLWSIKNMFISK